MNKENYYDWEAEEIELLPAETDEEEQWRKEYEREVRRQVDLEYLESLPPALKECRISEFVSTSKGKNRKKTRPREVVLFKYRDLTYTIRDGEPVMGKTNRRMSLDSLTQDILNFLPREERTVERLLEETRAIDNVRKNNRYNLL